MRVLVFVVLVFAIAACRPPRTADYANLLAQPDMLPPAGTSAEVLTAWFDQHGYAPGPRVLQSTAELQRREGDPLVYALESERTWWLTRHRTTHHLCVTRREIYYRVDGDGHLSQAIQKNRSEC